VPKTEVKKSLSGETESTKQVRRIEGRAMLLNELGWKGGK
jgi:hypothetical protein